MANDPVVYVIDDDDAARDSLAFLLGSAQFVVNAYDSAKAFLDALPTLEPGCVISDIRMPETDGLELLKRLKTRNIGWPIILITGHADLPLAIEAIRLGAADLIEKPYDAEAVKAALTTISETAKAFPDQFKPGTEQGDKEASPKIWENMADFKARADKLSADADTILAQLPADQAGVGGALKTLGANCGGCHQAYRIKE